MHQVAKRKVLHAWIACLAILFSALAPSISHALATPAGNGGKVEMCTGAGMKLVSVDANDAQPGLADTVARHFQHCAYCSSQAASFALLPQVAPALAATGGSAPYPDLFYQAPRPLFSWARPSSRAPPFFA
jgi:hypothetical protein